MENLFIYHSGKKQLLVFWSRNCIVRDKVLVKVAINEIKSPGRAHNSHYFNTSDAHPPGVYEELIKALNDGVGGIRHGAVQVLGILPLPQFTGTETGVTPSSGW